MKKIYLLTVLVLTISVSFAQMGNKNSTSQQLTNSMIHAISVQDLNLQKTQVQAIANKCDAKVRTASFNSIGEAIQARQKTPQAAPSVSYLRPDGSLLYGFTRDFMAYNSYVLLYGPARTALDFEPYSDTPSATFTWVLPTSSGDVSLADATDSYGVLHRVNPILAAGKVFWIPKVTAKAAGGTTSYQLGGNVTYQYMFSGNVERDDPSSDNTSLGSVSEFPPLTLANLNARRPNSGNLYNSFSSGESFSPAYTLPGYGACTGLMQVLPQMKSPLYAESVTLLCTTSSATSTVVPKGGNLKLQLYFLTDAGDLGDLIAESTTNTFYRTTSDQKMGAFVFTFPANQPLVIDTIAPVAVIISGFNSSWDFAALFGDNNNNGLPGSSYTLHGNHVATVGFTNAPDIPVADLYIQFNGIFNCLVVDKQTPSFKFPVAGGSGVSSKSADGKTSYNNVNLFSSFNTDGIKIASKPNWITSVTTDNTLFSSNNVIMLFAQASALSGGATSRSGEIVVTSLGVSATIPVVQGDFTGMDTPKIELTRVVRDGDNFVLRYPDSATFVDVYNVAGQKVATYQLSTSGKFTIPAGNYSKGIYLFNFRGAKGISTVKVIK